MNEAREHKHVAVRINGGTSADSLRYAFSNSYTVLSELMQNARRAGASYVSEEYDAAAEMLTVYARCAIKSAIWSWYAPFRSEDPSAFLGLQWNGQTSRISMSVGSCFCGPAVPFQL